jgi:hypothetical protein
MLNMNHLTMLLPRSRVHVNLSNDLGSYVVEDIPFWAWFSLEGANANSYKQPRKYFPHQESGPSQ